jgi:hypothetical protein
VAPVTRRRPRTRTCCRLGKAGRAGGPTPLRSGSPDDPVADSIARHPIPTELKYPTPPASSSALLLIHPHATDPPPVDRSLLLAAAGGGVPACQAKEAGLHDFPPDPRSSSPALSRTCPGDLRVTGAAATVRACLSCATAFNSGPRFRRARAISHPASARINTLPARYTRRTYSTPGTVRGGKQSAGAAPPGSGCAVRLSSAIKALRRGAPTSSRLRFPCPFATAGGGESMRRISSSGRQGRQTPRGARKWLAAGHDRSKWLAPSDQSAGQTPPPSTGAVGLDFPGSG